MPYLLTLRDCFGAWWKHPVGFGDPS